MLWKQVKMDSAMELHRQCRVLKFDLKSNF